MCILVVDDDPIARLIIEQNLKLAQIDNEILSAENGKEALNMIKSSKPEIVLLDLNMPVMNGFDLLDSMTENGIETDVYIITSSTLQNDRTKSYKYQSVKGFFEKPINKTDIDQVKKSLKG
ncbi:response regulator [Salibacter halophilus]|uniref:Response regulator n=1 Tax=Salibacter halophilus TaxID=1803916 RepID=A0A6N6MC84_9FLAO|nr:response regulator [Salibacter halophilus]KAB1066143.1 response regulator [Salibacter halophilus]